MINSTNDVQLNRLGYCHQLTKLYLLNQAIHQCRMYYSVTLNSKQTNPLANGQGLLPLCVLLDKAIKDFPFNLHTLCREGGRICMSLHDHFQSLTNKALFRLCWMQLSCIKKIQYLENKYLELSRKSRNVTICQAF